MSKPSPKATESKLLEALGEPDPFKAHLLANPDQFILHYFPHKIKKLEPFHLRLIDLAINYSEALVLFPVAHGKTTLISTLLPIWEICRNPNVRIAIVAKNEDEAKNKIGRTLMAEFMGNDALMRDFGPFKPEHDDTKPWSLTNMTVAKRTSRAKEPTLGLFGAGSKGTLGHRADWVVCDDVVTEKNSATPTQRDSLRDWFDLTVDTMGEFEESRLTVVGTLFDPEDLYSDIMTMMDPESGEPIYEVQVMDAIVDEETQQTLWPDRWSWQRLMREKSKKGTINFNRRYRNIAVDPSRMVFKEEYVKGGRIGKEKYPGCLDSTYSIGQFDPSWRRYSGFDPAVGLTRHAKFCAHCTIAVGSCPIHEKCYWILDVVRQQMTLPQQADLIIAQHAKYDLLESMIEANSYQGGLMQVVDERMEKLGVAYKTTPHFTTRINKPDPELGIQAMSPWFERGAVHIPYQDQVDRRKMNIFIDELIQYPDARTSDTVMAFWFAFRAAQSQAPVYKSFNRLNKPMAWAQKRKHRTVLNPYFVA